MLKILSDDDFETSATPAVDDGAAEAVFTLTERAAKQVAKLMAAEKTPATALRIGVRGGGCSGLQYFMEFTAASEPTDHVLVQHGVTLFMDRKSAAYLKNAELDFSSGIQSSGFKWKNPNEKKSCGCGESFAV